MPLVQSLRLRPPGPLFLAYGGLKWLPVLVFSKGLGAHNWEFEVQLETPCHRATQVPVQPRGLCVLHIHMDTGGDKFGSPCGRMQLSTQDVASGGQAELCLAEEPE